MTRFEKVIAYGSWSATFVVIFYLLAFLQLHTMLWIAVGIAAVVSVPWSLGLLPISLFFADTMFSISSGFFRLISPEKGPWGAVVGSLLFALAVSLLIQRVVLAKRNERRIPGSECKNDG